MLFSSNLLLAAENIYIVADLGAANTELQDVDENKPSYKLGFGYQFASQWYVEAGLQKLASDSIHGLISSPSSNNQDPSLELSALYIAFLGKASSSMGELFYRVGILKTDIRAEQMVYSEQACNLGEGTLIMAQGSQDSRYCQIDEKGVAGVIGLGFDFTITKQIMLRTEVEYIAGQHELKASAAYIGLRYNF